MQRLRGQRCLREVKVILTWQKNQLAESASTLINMVRTTPCILPASRCITMCRHCGYCHRFCLAILIQSQQGLRCIQDVFVFLIHHMFVSQKDVILATKFSSGHFDFGPLQKHEMINFCLGFCHCESVELYCVHQEQIEAEQNEHESCFSGKHFIFRPAQSPRELAQIYFIFDLISFRRLCVVRDDSVTHEGRICCRRWQCTVWLLFSTLLQICCPSSDSGTENTVEQRETTLWSPCGPSPQIPTPTVLSKTCFCWNPSKTEDLVIPLIPTSEHQTAQNSLKTFLEHKNSTITALQWKKYIELLATFPSIMAAAKT